MPCPIPARIGVANGDLINASRAALANDAPELNVARSSRAFSLAAGPISLAPPSGEPNRLCKSASVPWAVLTGGANGLFKFTVLYIISRAKRLPSGAPQLWYV